ncbi:MAG: ASCH domain-containing protein, partial [bacterium]|nr:ASCH domain-containing protein [bacterium]
MKKSWGLIPKILAGQKKIESRWYKTKHAPWGHISSGDTVYFKNSGGEISVRARVGKVISFSDLTPEKVKEILTMYGADDGIEKAEIPGFFKRFRDKKCCLLIFLKDPEKVTPFEINKAGFGAMA